MITASDDESVTSQPAQSIATSKSLVERFRTALGPALPGIAQEFFLKQARVALSDGRAFGEEGAGFVRLNFATSRGILDDVLARMDAALAGHVAAP